MIRIGFSKKYFTLWDVIETTEFEQVEGVNLPFKLISFNYLQNLSMDEEQAKRKAIFKNVENFEIDFDLYGRNASFSKRQELFSKIPSDKSFFFEFGRLKGQKIQDCNDFDYLFWFFNESQNIHAKARLLENGFEEIDGQVVHAEHAKKIQQSKINKMQNETMFSEKRKKELEDKKFKKYVLKEQKIYDLNVFVGEYLFEQDLICDDWEAIGYFLDSKTKNEVAKLAFDAIGHRYYNYSMKVKNSFKNGN